MLARSTSPAPGPGRRRRRRSLALIGAGALIASVTVLDTGTASASSHREAPLIAGDPRADNTDVYAFVSQDKAGMVTLIANWIPMEEPNGGPNFYSFATDARYNIKIDNDGDGVADVVYSWTFQNHIRDDANQFLYNTGVVRHLNDPTLNVYQTYTLTETHSSGSQVLLSNKIVTPSDVGKASMPDYAQLRQQNITQGQLPGGGQNYVGQADDPFFLDLRIFDLLYGGNLSETGHDTLTGYNVNTIALQVPKAELALGHNVSNNPVIGVWSTTDRRSTDLSSGTASAYGGFHQVSRLGNPLINEAVVPLKFKDAFNTLSPNQDHTVQPVVDKVTDPIVPKLIESIYGIKAPKTPRNDLVEIFLTGIAKHAPTLDNSQPPIQADLNSQVLNKGVNRSDFVPAEELRLNMSVPVSAHPNRLGVLGGDLQGFPNGRRLSDDVVDIALQALEGAAQTGTIVAPLAAGDGVNKNDVAFGSDFPYVALPHTASVNTAG
jgi:hypothetical protein